ncbi:ABC transporter permease [Pelagibacterium montanilacus]|uniref:ABC transporter permease n=1 Tax=Pelagibacterium montanilacus TaxID=2185280 RepID=UPI000F8EA7D3|nr:ABC transporter permease [Pelagibacterium montanilacus]
MFSSSAFGPSRLGRALALGLPALLTIGALVLAWEAYVRFSGLSQTVLPAPTTVAAQAFAQRAALWANAVPTLQATGAGFALSLCCALAFSMIIDFVPMMRRVLFPVFIVFQTLPLVAIAPLIVLWFGFGLGPKIGLVALVTFFPMLVALVQGYGSTEREIEALLRSMGAGRLRVFLLARLPSALPYFFAGLRISITYAVVAAIFAEYSGAARGLGIYILNAKNSFRPDLVLSAVMVSAVLTLCLFALVAAIERLAMPWRHIHKEPTS